MMRLLPAIRRIGVGGALALLWVYRNGISPWKPACCRFTPSCSAYSAEAFRRFGFFRGTGMTVWRILRCHPFYRGPLHDPVPEKPAEPGKQSQQQDDMTRHG